MPHHRACEAGRVLQPGGTTGAMRAQVQGLQHPAAVQEALPYGGGGKGRKPSISDVRMGVTTVPPSPGHSRLASRRLQSLDGDVISTIQGTQGSGVPHLHQSTHLWNCVCPGTPPHPLNWALTADMGRALRLQANLHHVQGCHWGRSGDKGKMSMQDRVSPQTRHAQSTPAAPVPARLLLNREVTTAPVPEATIC